MSLSSTACRTKATGSDSTATYNYNFRIFSASDLLVTVRNTTTNVESVLVLTTDYTVSGVGLQSGTVALVNAGQAWMDTSGFLAANYIIIVRRVRPLTQLTSIRNQSAYYASVHEDEFDTLVMVDQQQDDQLQRAVLMPESVTSDIFNPMLPTSLVAPPPGAALIINPAGNGWALGSPVVGWKSVTLTYAQLQAAANTKQVTAFSLPAGFILMGAAIKHSIAFAGGAISAVTLDLGTVGTPDLFLTAFDVFQAVADSAFVNAMPFNIQSFAGATDIKLRANSVTAQLNALTQGTVTIYYWYMNLNQGS